MSLTELLCPIDSRAPFKPFVYTAALQAAILPTILDDSPVEYVIPDKPNRGRR